jgi:hypothetical protein
MEKIVVTPAQTSNIFLTWARVDLSYRSLRSLNSIGIVELIRGIRIRNSSWQRLAKDAYNE